MIIMRWFCFFAFMAVLAAGAAPAWGQPASLTVQQIMQDPDSWVGGWPSQPFWSENGERLYFSWNPQGQFADDSLFVVPRTGGEPTQVSPERRRTGGPTFDGWHHGEHIYTSDFQRKVYIQGGDLYLYHRADDRVQRLTQTRTAETNPRFTLDGTAIIFERDDNLFRHDLETGAVVQVSDLRSGKAPKDDALSDQDAFLEAQQQELFDYLREQKEEREARTAAQERDRAADNPPPTFYRDDKAVQQLQLDPTERFVTFALTQSSGATSTSIINYVTESGYAEEVTARAKVGAPQAGFELYVQDLQRDTTYQVNLHQLEGAYDVPAFLQEKGVTPDSSKSKRHLTAYGPYWSPSGRLGVLDIRSDDNKDRWIAQLDPEMATLTLLDRQHDEAWIAGPGISWFGGASTVGWLPDDRHFFFQSEATGYSHLYVVDVEEGDVRAVTEGDFEVFAPMLSQDGQTWFFSSSEESPFVRHYYRMPLDGGPRTRLTTMDGNNAVTLHPDETQMAVLRSFTTAPPEVYLQQPQAEPTRITHSPTEAWAAYPWRTGELIEIEASDGVPVPAQVFVPEEPNGAAVLFVHGAGYLQNVHRWWSSYFREYMFHNLLVERGYTILNVDFRASAGYGRDWRTAIYRHMGGRDLGDYIDASQFVTDEYGIPAERVFIYGGSYGGFITLMALFTAPEHFGGGAALRSVTDWAHYNHTYTSNILNTPATDSVAFTRSSPINFADGLEDPLVMLHGMLDSNVQPQDIIRLSQRLIELGKEDWELAVYPVEGHGFTEPSSWTDEYRRILKLIEESVGPEAAVHEETPVLEDSNR